MPPLSISDSSAALEYQSFRIKMSSCPHLSSPGSEAHSLSLVGPRHDTAFSLFQEHYIYDTTLGVLNARHRLPLVGGTFLALSWCVYGIGKSRPIRERADYSTPKTETPYLYLLRVSQFLF